MVERSAEAFAIDRGGRGGELGRRKTWRRNADGSFGERAKHSLGYNWRFWKWRRAWGRCLRSRGICGRRWWRWRAGRHRHGSRAGVDRVYGSTPGAGGRAGHPAADTLRAGATRPERQGRRVTEGNLGDRSEYTPEPSAVAGKPGCARIVGRGRYAAVDEGRRTYGDSLCSGALSEG